MRKFSIYTKLVHSGERKSPPVGQPVATPIYSTVTYTYATMAEMEQVFAGEGGDFIYSRYGNPTVAALQDSLAAIENGKVSIAYGSGMAASQWCEAVFAWWNPVVGHDADQAVWSLAHEPHLARQLAQRSRTR